MAIHPPSAFTPNDTAPTTEPTRERRGVAGGAVLILLGIALLIGPLTGWQFTWLALPTLAVIFLAWGLIMRTFGLLIPGGILAGIALGTWLMQTRPGLLDGPDNGGIFLLCFAAGWGLITLLSPLTEGGFRWWPLIPGGIMAVIGTALLADQLQMLAWLNIAGPLLLIGLGVWIIFRRRE
ncbi:MAG: hypothetical protein KIT77_28875 [Caldilinea sp.]|nr:hypothetical protein [Caldilineaceae bacterium]MCW5845300.1 hypothetical protein [Caldilinea sp.]